MLFTDEPLYSGNEEFRVMRISASYGHGEGVVGNLGIATDTVTILISDAHPDQLYVLYDNKMKRNGLPLSKTLMVFHCKKLKILSSFRVDELYLPRCLHDFIIGECLLRNSSITCPQTWKL